MALFELDELRVWAHLPDLDIATATLAREQATTHLESEVGVRLTQQTATVVYHPRWDDQWIDLPVPTTDVATVVVDGETLAADDYQVVDFRLYRRVGWGGSRWANERTFVRRMSEDDYPEVAVTMTYGFDVPPGEFKTWGLILATQAARLAPDVGVQARSSQIDDYSESVTYATGGGQVFAGLSLPPRVLSSLRARYGRGVDMVAVR